MDHGEYLFGTLSTYKIFPYLSLSSIHVLFSVSHTIGVVKGHEIYDLLNNSFSDVFSTSNKIIKEGKICVNDYDIPVEIFLGGDYKVILYLHVN